MKHADKEVVPDSDNKRAWEKARQKYLLDLWDQMIKRTERRKSNDTDNE